MCHKIVSTMIWFLVISVTAVENLVLDLVILHLNRRLTTAIEECQQGRHPNWPGLEQDSLDEDVTNLKINFERFVD